MCYTLRKVNILIPKKVVFVSALIIMAHCHDIIMSTGNRRPYCSVVLCSRTQPTASEGKGLAN